MRDVIDDFVQRRDEVNDYLQLLKSLESEEKLLLEKQTGRTSSAFNTQAFKVMKASVFLLVYNAVESAIRAGYAFVYSQMNAEAIQLAKLTTETREIWLRQQFARMDKSEELAPKHFREFVSSIADLICSGSTIEMDKKYLPVSGNLNALRVRTICQKHGVDANVSPAAKGGAKLDVVWARRNQLSHGEVQFSGCGQDFTVADLQDIVNETFTYVGDILSNIGTFAASRQYQQSP